MIHKNCEIKNAYEGLISNYTNIVVKLLDTQGGALRPPRNVETTRSFSKFKNRFWKCTTKTALLTPEISLSDAGSIFSANKVVALLKLLFSLDT